MVSLTQFARNGDTYRCRGNKEGEMANVITYGTYDLFHIGHLKLLQRASLKICLMVVGKDFKFD